MLNTRQHQNENKAYRKMQQGSGTRILVEEYKKKRIKETIHKRRRKKNG
jgi:hypothetical protein